MLSLLTGTPMSAADLARELGLSHANASYHLRHLADAGAVVEAGEQRIRGGLAKLYRYPHDAEPPRSDASDEDRVRYARALFQELERRLRHRLDVPGGGLSGDLEGWVAPEAFERARALVEEASQVLHDANRPPHAEGTVHVSWTGWLFRMDES